MNASKGKRMRVQPKGKINYSGSDILSDIH